MCCWQSFLSGKCECSLAFVACWSQRIFDLTDFLISELFDPREFVCKVGTPRLFDRPGPDLWTHLSLAHQTWSCSSFLFFTFLGGLASWALGHRLIFQAAYTHGRQGCVVCRVGFFHSGAFWQVWWNCWIERHFVVMIHDATNLMACPWQFGFKSKHWNPPSPLPGLTRLLNPKEPGLAYYNVSKHILKLKSRHNFNSNNSPQKAMMSQHWHSRTVMNLIQTYVIQLNGFNSCLTHVTILFQLSRHAAIIATAFEEGEVAVHIEERFLLAYIFCFFSQFSILSMGLLTWIHQVLYFCWTNQV